VATVNVRRNAAQHKVREDLSIGKEA
jgi:hypothetical protein